MMTSDIAAAMRFAQEVDAGNLDINWEPGDRADQMPYGGLKARGLGKECQKYGILKMTEAKTVIFHGV
jgi:acyl-CoA reductase-like NAD-dependent aldehyde dehydrogenase